MFHVKQLQKKEIKRIKKEIVPRGTLKKKETFNN
jgi:hypothetical protein